MSSPTTVGVVPWPSDAATAFRRAGLWEDRPLFSYVADRAAEHPDALAVVDGATRLTYREVVQRAEAGADRLLERGLRPDDRVLVQLPNSWEFVVFTLACFRAGVVPVMALPAHRRHELEYLADLAEVRSLVVPETHREFDHQRLAEEIAHGVKPARDVFVLGQNITEHNVDLRELLAPSADPDAVHDRLEAVRVKPDAVAVFLLSGGTTGLPKLIPRTHNDYAYNVRATSAATGMTRRSTYLIALPAGHNFPLACPGFLGALFAGGKVVSAPSPEPMRAFDLISREGVTVAAVVPAVAQRWIEHQELIGGDALSSLEVLQVGGSRLADELAARIAPVLGATLQQVFGMAEGLINMTRLEDPDTVIQHTQGRPVSDADEVKVVDDAGADLPVGSTGVLLTRGPYTPRGYYRAPEHNARSFTPEGWYITGDIVELRADGNLIVQGRDKDMINRGGEKVSGEEVENLIYRFPQVALTAAVSMPDEKLGERVCVFVTLRPSTTLTLAQVRDSMRLGGVAEYKHPERLEIVTDLPLTKVGKIDKKLLRAQIAARLESERESRAATGSAQAALSS